MPPLAATVKELQAALSHCGLLQTAWRLAASLRRAAASGRRCRSLVCWRGCPALSRQAWRACEAQTVRDNGSVRYRTMSLGLILLVILALLLAGGFSRRFGGYGYGYGHGCLGLIAILLIILLVLLFGGRL